jgi:uncharacterized protein
MIPDKISIFEEKMKNSTVQFHRNNLDKSISPYLRQHQDNPVWWQEFSDDVLEYAATENKPVLLSSGYSTCHWCHVMAADAFSHQPTADFLNEHFLCIKIDREMRPDMDAWMMSYLQNQHGQGGWPLNVFVTHDLKPFFSMMYAPSEEGQYGRPSFRRILEHVLKMFSTQNSLFIEWKMDVISGQSSAVAGEEYLLDQMEPYFDRENGGLSGKQKFPPHTTLHYLLTIDHERNEIDEFVRYTLMKMSMSGLHDHLQGGFYRYCVDPEWNIPHFEKMLYDQAMMLMNYSLAAARYRAKGYVNVVRSLLSCLDETFENDGMYISAFDADTNHHEGLTYLWDQQEINAALNDEEMKLFYNDYHLYPFEGKYHLLRQSAESDGLIERKLLDIRMKREQPFRDEKIITSWNAYTGIALLMAQRYAGIETKGKATRLFQNIMKKHRLQNGFMAHSSIGSHVQQMSFLEDNAAMLLFATYLFEEGSAIADEMDQLYQALINFRINGQWYESMGTVPGNIPASVYDHPVPSAVSAAQAGIARYSIMTGQHIELPQAFMSPLSYDYYNLAVKWAKGDFPVISGPEIPDFSKLPPGVIFYRSKEWTMCRNSHCVSTSKDEMYRLFDNWPETGDEII